MRDRRDVTEAVSLYADTVLRACSVYLRPPENEDAFQETFLRYARHEEPFKSEEHRKAWLIRVAMNVCKDMLKAARRRDESLDDLPESSLEAETSTTEDEHEPKHEELVTALRSLDERYRTPLYLKYYEGMQASQIARLTGTPEATVYTNLSRGRRLLKEALTHGGRDA